MSRDFERALLALREDPGGYAVFAEETRDVWQRFAAYLNRRWKAPLGVDEADLAQELRIAGWLAMQNWDPNRGTTIDRYVRFNAIDKAKKWLHKQRDSYRRDGSAPSRAPMVFSSFERPDEEPGAAQDRLAWVPPDAEDRLEERELRAPRWQRDRKNDIEAFFWKVRQKAPFEARTCLDVVAESGGDLELAADKILADPGLSVALRVGSDEEALSVVRKSVNWAFSRLRGEGTTDNGGPAE